LSKSKEKKRGAEGSSRADEQRLASHRSDRIKKEERFDQEGIIFSPILQYIPTYSTTNTSIKEKRQYLPCNRWPRSEPSQQWDSGRESEILIANTYQIGQYIAPEKKKKKPKGKGVQQRRQNLYNNNQWK
jgi:hypothetical protein